MRGEVVQRDWEEWREGNLCSDVVQKQTKSKDMGIIRLYITREKLGGNLCPIVKNIL